MSERVHGDDSPDRDGASRVAAVRPRQLDPETRERPDGLAGILALQRDAGNDAVGSLLASAPVQREPVAAPEAAAAPHPQLSIGASGPAVSELQEKLSLVVAEAKLNVTGHFDSHTDEVVKRFQVQSALKPDGIAGPHTWAALDSLRGGTEVGEEDQTRLVAAVREANALFDAGNVEGALADYMVIYSDKVAAHKAARGGLVFNIAGCHHRLGHFSEAISFYEEAMGLPGVGADVGGSAAENLRRARLHQPYQGTKEMEAERAAFAGEETPNAHPQLSLGVSGPAVSELQEKLTMALAEAKLKVTGLFDSQTNEDLKRFQVQSALKPDGIAGPDTWAALDSLRGGIEINPADQARLEALVREANALFDAGNVEGALTNYMSIYADKAAAHKAARGGLVFNIAGCHHRLGHFSDAASFYEEAMALPGVDAELSGSAAENLRRARLQQPYQGTKEMEAERAALKPDAAPEPHPLLSIGSSGPAVSELQEKVRTAVAESNLKVTGQFDSHTEEVVKRFQVQSAFRPDGIVGPHTWGALDSVEGGLEIDAAGSARLKPVRDAADALFDAGDFAGALSKYMELYGDPVIQHKSIRAGMVYKIAGCHQNLGHFQEAINFYQEVMSLPGAGAEMAGSAAENMRRARLGEPFQDSKELEAERATFKP